MLGSPRHQQAHTSMIFSALGQARTDLFLGSLPKGLILV
ncbi:hypothetical protein LINPERHAP1_LOCUS39461 [Linum perenne]